MGRGDGNGAQMPPLQRPIVLIRAGAESDPAWVEAAAAARVFPVARSLHEVPEGSLVIGRYALQPFYQAIEQELAARGCQLINSYEQHRFAADLGNWSDLLGSDTFSSWTSLDQVPDGIPLIVKGETNGRKHDWAESFYAADKTAAGRIAGRLRSDPLLTGQQLYFRAYEPLRELLASDGQRPPIVEEYRFFVCDGQLLASGFYWGQCAELAAEAGLDPSLVPAEFLTRSIARIGARIRFYALDIARTAAGQWRVVEVNDGCASGLTTIEPERLYRALAKTLG